MSKTKIETKQQNQEKQKENLSVYSNISLKYTNIRAEPLNFRIH